MTRIWTSSAAADATAGKAEGAWEALRVVIDSRNIARGDLFVALKGDHFDGHAYVGDALAQGATAAMVAHVPGGVSPSSLLVVENTLKGLEDLGRVARKQTRAKVVGVTGSVGKTSAKEMLRLALSAHGDTYATSGNYNNHIGTPLNLANLPADTGYAVFEMGMNHAGEIAHLTKMVKPDVAVITNIEAVHMEFFRSIDAIANAKCEIFEGMKSSGIAVLNRDSAHYALMAKRADERGVTQCITFGEHEKADCRLIQYEPTMTGCRVEASIFGKRLDFAMQAIGRHWAITSLLTLAAGSALALDSQKTALALANFSEVEGRGRVMPLAVAGGDICLIDDSYNASPAAMRAAFAKTAEVWEGRKRAGRKIAVLGDMLELGEQAATLHKGLARDIQSSGFDTVFTAGAWMQHLHEALPAAMRGAHVGAAMDLLPILQKALRGGDIVLVKGSHGSKMYELVKTLREKASVTKEKMHAV